MSPLFVPPTALDLLRDTSLHDDGLQRHVVQDRRSGARPGHSFRSGRLQCGHSTCLRLQLSPGHPRQSQSGPALPQEQTGRLGRGNGQRTTTDRGGRKP